MIFVEKRMVLSFMEVVRIESQKNGCGHPDKYPSSKKKPGDVLTREQVTYVGRILYHV